MENQKGYFGPEFKAVSEGAFQAGSAFLAESYVLGAKLNKPTFAAMDDFRLGARTMGEAADKLHSALGPSERVAHDSWTAETVQKEAASVRLANIQNTRGSLADVSEVARNGSWQNSLDKLSNRNIDVSKLVLRYGDRPKIDALAKEYNTAASAVADDLVKYKASHAVQSGNKLLSDFGAIAVGQAAGYAVDRLVFPDTPISHRTAGISAMTTLPLVAMRNIGFVGKAAGIAASYLALRSWDKIDESNR